VCKDSNSQLPNKYISFKILRDVEESFRMKFKNRNIGTKKWLKSTLKKEESIFFSRIIISHYIFYTDYLKVSSINF